MGIGTTSPAAKLEIKADNNEKFILNATLDTNSYQNQITFQNAGTTYAAIIAGKNASNVSVGLVFNTGTTEKMRLDASGNLGIGTTSPASKLNVADTSTNCTVTVTNSASNFQVQSNTNDGYFNLNGSGNIIFRSGTPSVSERARIDSSGNLGVGTSSPTKRLEVQSSTSGGEQIRCIDNSGVGGGGRGGGVSMGGVSNDTGPVFTDYVRILGLKTNSTQGNTAGGLLIQVNDGSANASAMSISSARIVTMDAYGAGTATFSAAGVISSVSDETWKIKDGVPVDPDAMIKKLEPGYWFYNDEKKEIFGTDRQLGFYAQNVNSAIGPEAAPTPEEGKPWGYYDRSVLAVTVMSLQKALATIETLTARITALEGA
jgi:hypothetical protein